jgi:hypothetical protein
LELLNDLKLAHCERFDFPRRTTPASRNLAATVASRGTFAPRREYDPAVLFIWSFVAMLFLISMGTPCRGLRIVPLALSASRVAAMDSASGFISVTALRIEFVSSIRRIYAWGRE